MKMIGYLLLILIEGVSSQRGGGGWPGGGGGWMDQGWDFREPPYQPSPSDYPDSCGGTYTLRNSNNNIYDLYSPLYPNRVKSGRKCEFTIRKGSSTGSIKLTFKKAERLGDFEIDSGGKSWKFGGSSGLNFILSPNSNMTIKYKAPGNTRDDIWEEYTAFMMQVKYVDGNYTDPGICSGNREFRCTKVHAIGFICLTGPERCDGRAICPDRSDEQRCGECLGDPYIDFGKIGVNKKYSVYSSGWPGEYANNNTCQWVAKAPDGYVIHALLKFFDIEQTYDFVFIGEGEILSYKKSQLSKLSGIYGRKQFTSAYPGLWIKFESDYTVRDSGFQIELSVQDALEVRGKKTDARTDAPQSKNAVTTFKITLQTYFLPWEIPEQNEQTINALSIEPCTPREFDCAVGVCFNVAQTRCDGMADCMNFKDEYVCDEVKCDGNGHLCNSINKYNFTPCVTNDQLCDRSFDCPSKDDESICHLIACPIDCNCTYVDEIDYKLRVVCNKDWIKADIDKASRTTSVLELSGGDYPLLKPGLFADRHVFLKALSLVFNNIAEIAPKTFQGLPHLTWLNLSYNKMEVLPTGFLKELEELQGLILWDVPIREIEPFAFEDLSKLTTIVIVTKTREAIHVTPDSFMDLPVDLHLYVDNHRLCCLFHEYYIPGRCIPVSPQSPLFHCGELFQQPILRLLFWASGILTFASNVFLLLWKTKRLWRDTEEKPHRVQNFFVWNLGIVNMLMACYLAILCAADFIYGNEYYIHSEEWWVSAQCRLAGFLSILSAEGCVFFLVAISVDVYIRVENLETEKRMDIKTARWVALGVWMAAGLIAMTGSLSTSVDSDFYYLSDFCLGLPLIRRPSKFVIEGGDATSPFGNRTIDIKVPRGTKPAWALSIFLFMVLNVICFVVAVVLYRDHKTKVGTLRAQWKKEKDEELARREEEYRREMEEDGLEDEEEGEKDKGDDDDEMEVDDDDLERPKKHIADEVEKIKEQRKAMGIEDEIEGNEETTKSKKQRGSTKKGIKQSFKKASKKKMSFRKRRKSKQKVRRAVDVNKKDPAAVMTDATDVKVDIQPGENGDDEDSDKEVPIISKSVVSEKGGSSDAEAGHSDTESKKQSDGDDINDEDGEKKTDGEDGSDAESDVSAVESEPEPYDKQTCRMFRYMRLTLYFDMFCWSPLIILGFLSQCGVDIAPVAYAYIAASILPMISYMTPIVIMFSTCDCFGEPEIPDYIINSDGEIQPITDMDVYQQTWMMMQI